jgi:hypothetical protein
MACQRKGQLFKQHSTESQQFKCHMTDTACQHKRQLFERHRSDTAQRVSCSSGTCHTQHASTENQLFKRHMSDTECQHKESAVQAAQVRRLAATRARWSKVR